jgi:hypothetical protein
MKIPLSKKNRREELNLGRCMLGPRTRSLFWILTFDDLYFLRPIKNKPNMGSNRFIFLGCVTFHAIFVFIG